MLFPPRLHIRASFQGWLLRRTLQLPQTQWLVQMKPILYVDVIILFANITGIIPEAFWWGDDRYDRLLCPGLQPGPPSQTPGGLGQGYWSVSAVTWLPKLELRRWRSSGPSSLMNLHFWIEIMIIKLWCRWNLWVSSLQSGCSDPTKIRHHGPLLLTWFNIDLSMDK